MTIDYRKAGSTAWLISLLLSMPVQAAKAGKETVQDIPGATVEELLNWMERHSPELMAMNYEAEAAAERVQPAGALEDPSFSLEWRDIPRDNPSLAPERVGSVKYTLSQAFPLWGKRDLKREIAAAEADQAQGRRRSVAAELRSNLKIAFAERYQALQAALLTREMLALMRDLERLAQTRYANGLAPQQDVIKAQVEQTSLQADLITLQTEQRQAHARLNTVLGRPAQAPLAEPRALPGLPKPAVLEGLEERARRASPLLYTQAAQITAAEHNQRLTLKNRYPDLIARVSAIQEEERLEGWELMLEVNVPLRQETRRSQEGEASAMLAAAQSRYEANTAQVLGQLREAVAAIEAARSQHDLLKTSLLPQTELTFLSALAGYRAGKVDFTTLLDALRQIRQARLNDLKAQVEQRIRLAEIERLVGEEL